MINLFHNNFKYKEIEFVNFIYLDEIELIEILGWRNDENTRKWMKNCDIIPVNQHIDYCKKLSLRHDIAQWKVKYLGKNIGVVSINQFNEKNKSCEWGFYMKKNCHPEDVLFLYYYAQHLFFNHLNILKLIGTVKVENESAMLFNGFFDFLEIEKIKIDNITYSIRELKKSNWFLNKKNSNSLIRDFSTYYRKYKIENNV
jgi:hypothetical protein